MAGSYEVVESCAVGRRIGPICAPSPAVPRRVFRGGALDACDGPLRLIPTVGPRRLRRESWRARGESQPRIHRRASLVLGAAVLITAPCRDGSGGPASAWAQGPVP